MRIWAHRSTPKLTSIRLQETCVDVRSKTHKRRDADVNLQASFADAEAHSDPNKLRVGLDETHQGHNYTPHKVDEREIAALELGIVLGKDD